MAMADDQFMTLDGPAIHPRSDGRYVTRNQRSYGRYRPTDRPAGERGPRYVGSMEPHCNTSTFVFVPLCARTECPWLRIS